ncbi:MAG: hypothetical protein IH622_13255 [Ochrobactrum anthropi]|uniref:HEPN domain-containing protein n=1 Tax=Brucella anthropi TaxID=529 RepID=A0A8I0T8N8_BRUAN|nr:hypothetical protein [Brucella anthropi]MBE0561763.1 hypothetical protein [Brucella anthropi]
MMEKVAHHLQVHAFDLLSADDRDVFGRSAYNRYYYAAFLRARDMMRRLNPAQWGELAHANYPEILRGSIRKELKRGKERSQRIHDNEAVGAFSRALTAADGIANLMRDASRVRVVADYNPDIPIEFLPGGRFSLNNVDITTAHRWVGKVDVWATAIEAAWRHLDV